MKAISVWFMNLTVLLVCACSPVKTDISNQYKLTAYSPKRYYTKPGNQSIYVSLPQTSGTYQTEQMLYVNKPHEVRAFAKNAWIDPPANMLFPLIIQSLEKSNVFRAVSSSTFAEKSNYQLDTQLIEFHQNFLNKPSVVQISVKVLVSDLDNNNILGSHIFRQQVPCPRNNPYGGVIAANIASEKITAEITEYVIHLTQAQKATTNFQK